MFLYTLKSGDGWLLEELSHDWIARTCNKVMGFPSGSAVKNPPAVRETRVWFLGGEDPLEEGMAIDSIILAWRISGTEEPGGLRSTGSQRGGHDCSGWAHTHVKVMAAWSQHHITDGNCKIFQGLSLPAGYLNLTLSFSILQSYPSQPNPLLFYCSIPLSFMLSGFLFFTQLLQFPTPASPQFAVNHCSLSSPLNIWWIMCHSLVRATSSDSVLFPPPVLSQTSLILERSTYIPFPFFNTFCWTQRPYHNHS